MSVPSSPSGPSRLLDTSELVQPVDDASLAAFIADAKATDKPWRRITTGRPRPGVSDVLGELVPALVPLAGVIMFLVIGGTSLVDAVWRFTLTAPFPLNLVIVGFVVLVLLGVLVTTRQAIQTIRSLTVPRSWWVAAYRLVRFAAANGLRYGHDEAVSHAGVIFGTGIDRVAARRLCTTTGRALEIGNYRYTIPSENRENADVHHWGYVAITLDRRLPHLLLDAQANNRSHFGIRTSNLPVELARDQRLSLGGEFDQHFHLYAPVDYGRDAFEIFTPDLMALFIDRLGTFDVEIVDDTMYVYGSPFDLLAPRTYAWLQEVVETVVARTVRRTERYADDFALLESAPGGPPRTDPGVAVGSTSAGPESSADPNSDPDAAQGSVFALSGEGPPVTASNRIAERGRRLRVARWGWASVFGLLLLAFWLYTEVIAPLFGLPGR